MGVHLSCKVIVDDPLDFQGLIGPHREHIFRVHRLPIHCVRCRIIFENEAQLTSHQRLPEMCALSSAGLPEGFTKEQEQELRKRKAKTQSDEDYWRAMFMILFPHDDAAAVPTPCKSP
jgi:hypothetical protein